MLTSAIEKEIDEIELLLVKGRYKEVIQSSNEILDREGITPEERIRTKIYQSWAEHLRPWESGSGEVALKLAIETYEECKQVDNLAFLFDSLLCLAFSYFSCQKHEEAYKTALEFERIFEKIQKEDPLLAKQKEPVFLEFQVFAIPSLYAFIGKKTSEDYIERSIEIIPQAMKLAERRNDMRPWDKYRSMRSGYNFQFLCFARVGDLDKSLGILTKLLNFAKEVGNKHDEAYAYDCIAGNYRHRGEYEKFLDFSMKRLKISEELDDKSAIIGHNTIMGIYYLAQGDHDKALEYIEKPLRYWQEKKHELNIAWSAWNVGAINRIKGNLDLALEYTEKAYTILNEKRPENWWGILGQLSLIYSLKGEVDKALQFEEESYEFHLNAGYDVFVASSLRRMGYIYWQKGERETAIKKTHESLEIYERLGNNLWIGTILADLIFFLTESDCLVLSKK